MFLMVYFCLKKKEKSHKTQDEFDFFFFEEASISIIFFLHPSECLSVFLYDSALHNKYSDSTMKSKHLRALCSL